MPSPTLSHRLATPCPAPHGVCSSSRATRLRGPSSTSGAREFEPPLCHSERRWENETQLSLLLNGGDDPGSFLDSEAHRPHPCLVRVPEEGEHPCPLFFLPRPHCIFPSLCCAFYLDAFPPHSGLPFKYHLCREAFSELLFLHGHFTPGLRTPLGLSHPGSQPRSQGTGSLTWLSPRQAGGPWKAKVLPLEPPCLAGRPARAGAHFLMEKLFIEEPRTEAAGFTPPRCRFAQETG